MIYGRAHSCGCFLKSGWTVGEGGWRAHCWLLYMRARSCTRTRPGRRQKDQRRFCALSQCTREQWGWDEIPGGGNKIILLTICWIVRRPFVKSVSIDSSAGLLFFFGWLNGIMGTPVIWPLYLHLRAATRCQFCSRVDYSTFQLIYILYLHFLAYDAVADIYNSIVSWH